jgi:hypothetical protein
VTLEQTALMEQLASRATLVQLVQLEQMALTV